MKKLVLVLLLLTACAAQQRALQNYSATLENATFVSVSEADRFLEDTDEVLGTIYHGQAKAYPLKALAHYGRIDDSIVDMAISVQYDAKCEAAAVYLRNKSASEPCATAPQMPSYVTTWSQWMAAYPNSRVLKTLTTYAAPDSGVIVYSVNDQIYPEEVLIDEHLIQDTLLIVHDPITGIVRAFNPVWHNQSLTFSIRTDRLFEIATNSEFDFAGQGLTRVYKGVQLRELPLMRYNSAARNATI